MNARTIIHTPLLALLLGACASPELTRRYDSVEWNNASDGLVEVSAFALDPPKANPQTTLLSLSERGQAAFIEALAGESTSSAELLATLGGSIGKHPAPGLLIDRTIVRKRVVISVERAGASRFRPEDRIHALRCQLALQPASASFRSWDRFSTAFDTVDLGKVSLTQSVSGELSVSATSAPTSGDPVARGGKLAASRNLAEEVSLKQRYVALSGMLRKHEAILVQEGVVGIDLSGNAFVDVTLKLPARAHQPVVRMTALRKGGVWVSQDKIDVVRSYVAFPASSSAIESSVGCEYVVRRVTGKGGRTVVEGDDEVRFVRGATADSTVELIPDAEMDFKLWIIGTVHGRELEIGGLPDTTSMQFLSYDEALAFLDWLRAEGNRQVGKVHVGNRQLSIAGIALTAQEIHGLNVDLRTP